MKCIDCKNQEECGTVSQWAIESKTQFKKRMNENLSCIDFDPIEVDFKAFFDEVGELAMEELNRLNKS